MEVEDGIAIDIEGNLWTCGSNAYGMLGNGLKNKYDSHGRLEISYDTCYFVQITKDIVFKKISANEYSCYALDENGDVWVWGNNANGKLFGDNGNISGYQLVPTKVIEDKKFIDISSSRRSVFAIDEDNALWGWGEGYCGSLGIGTIDSSKVPIRINDKIKYKNIETNGYHTFAIDVEGNIWGWGCNEEGEIGDGTTNNILEPIQITTGIKFKKIKIGYSRNGSNVAIDEDGNLWGWGMNYDGQLGDGTTTNRTIPTQIN